MRLRMVLASAVALTAACSFDPIDLRGKECPCSTGWVCHEGICVAEAPQDGGATIDARGVDTGMRDAGMASDSGGLDAGARDSGGVDAGPVETDAGTDAGMTMLDAGTDGGVVVSPSACSTLSAVFCDGFEDPGLTAWNDEYGTGTRTRVTSPLWRGAASLRATGSPGGLSAMHRIGLPDIGTEIYVRGYVYVPDSFTLVDIGLMYVGDMAGDGGFGIGVETGGRPYVYVDASSTGVTSMALAVPRNTWTCLRVHVRVSDTAGLVELFVGSDLAAMRSGIDTRLATPYTRFAAGLTYINPSNGAPTVYVDDVAVGSSPLPCD